MIKMPVWDDFVNRLSYSQIESSSDLKIDFSYLESHCATMKRHIMDMLAKQPPHGNIDVYISAVSGAISIICAQIQSQYLKAVAACKSDLRRKELISFYKRACDHFAELLSLLRTLVPEKFNRDTPIPFSVLLNTRIQIRKKLRRLRRLQALLDHHNAPLIPIIENIVNQHLQLENSMSYKTAAYLEFFLDSMNEIANKLGVDYNYYFHLRMIALNFNHPVYIEYCNAKLEEKYRDRELSRKLEAYMWYEMNLKRILVAKDLLLCEGFPSAQASLLVYVSEEIAYLQSALFGKASEEVTRIPTSLSVAELGLFFRIMVKEGVITESNQMKVFRLVKRYFSTKEAEEPSLESIRRKAYSSTPETDVSLINRLLGFIRAIKQKESFDSQ